MSANKVEGLHHLAICTANMKEQIEFFTDKLGMELQALYWMHGVENTWHGFLRLNDESSIAFVCNPEIQDIPVEMGKTHAGNPGRNVAAGVAQHIALKVQDHDEMMAMRDRLRSKGVPVIGPMNHGMCVSMYFAGPENLALELSYSNEPINAEAWCDPEVVEMAGISPEELERYKHPEGFEGQGGAVAQPGPDAPGPHQVYAPEVYRAMLQRTDDEIWNAVESEPPVQVSAGG